MDAGSHQKIVGYFIEEAKEHLETIEQAMSDLSSVIGEPERINELFRAAHSVKGGAAMLGFTSVQKTAHKLEDAFKILKEHDINVDRKLEGLFFKGYDTLQDLIDRLQRPFGLPDDEAEQILQEAQPTFNELQAHLDVLVKGGVPEQAAASSPSSPNIASQAKPLLLEMLELFKQKATPQSRQKLQQICTQLGKLAPQAPNWQTLLKIAKAAIANPKHSYRTLAPAIIKELKQGSDLLQLEKSDQITTSQSLQQLAKAKKPQILIPVEPKAAAQTLLKAFNQQQVSQIVQLLQVK
ncbi:MAG: Hpt domain-containing protein [Spirulinaceae cyanobacterium]